MIRPVDLKNNEVKGFSILVDFGKIYINAENIEDADSLACLMVVNEVDHGKKDGMIIVHNDRDLRKVTKCFNELHWAKAPRKIYTPMPFGRTGEEESGYGTDFIMARR